MLQAKVDLESGFVFVSGQVDWDGDSRVRHATLESWCGSSCLDGHGVASLASRDTLFEIEALANLPNTRDGSPREISAPSTRSGRSSSHTESRLVADWSLSAAPSPSLPFCSTCLVVAVRRANHRPQICSECHNVLIPNRINNLRALTSKLDR